VESPELPKIDTLAGRLKWAFERGTLNGTKVASAYGVTRAAVSGWLTGRTDNIKLETFFAVAGVLGVDPEWLATGQSRGHIEE
jgi:transcriptional regulator with XRE-family HTH domain